MNEIKCIKCNKDLFQVSNEKIKVRTNILIFEKSIDNEFEKCIIKCPFCKEDNNIPILLDINDSKIKHIILENS